MIKKDKELIVVGDRVLVHVEEGEERTTVKSLRSFPMLFVVHGWLAMLVGRQIIAVVAIPVAIDLNQINFSQ